MTNNTTNFDDIETVLQRLDSDMGAAESQGLLCGLLSAKGIADVDEWLRLVITEMDPKNALQREASRTLRQLYEETISGMLDSTCDFQPLLPDDKQPVADRIEALGEWCQGFLMGLSQGGIKDIENLPGEAGEIVKDLVEMSRAGSYELDGNEQDEESYMQLMEYLRTGVLLVNEVLNPTRMPPVTNQQLH